jgi:hypothetical protein
MTIVLIVAILFSAVYFMTRRSEKMEGVHHHYDNHNQKVAIFPQRYNPLFMKPVSGYSLMAGDTLMNPYAPPLRPPDVVPINVPTNIGTSFSSYRQVGILTPNHGNKGNNEKILALMGRPLYTNRDKWQYYTMSDSFNSIKLPIYVRGRSAMNEYGVDSLYDRDVVRVEGYNHPFRVTIYENNGLQYLPLP